MDCDKVRTFLQSIAVLAVEAQKALDNGNSTGIHECLDDIENDVERLRRELEK